MGGCGCKEVYINFPYSTCTTFLFIFKMFFWSCFCYFLQYIANVTKKKFEIVKKNRDPANIIASEASLLHELAGAFLWYIYIYICIHG